MAEIKVERRGQNGSQQHGLWLLVPVALLGIILISQAPHKTLNNQATVHGDTRGTLVYAGHRYMPLGQAVVVPDRELVAIGHSESGRSVYVRRGFQSGGGGGGAINAPATTYLRVANNTFQPLALQD